MHETNSSDGTFGLTWEFVQKCMHPARVLVGGPSNCELYIYRWVLRNFVSFYGP